MTPASERRRCHQGGSVCHAHHGARLCFGRMAHGRLGPLPSQEAQACWPTCSQRSVHLRPPCHKPSSTLLSGAPGTQPQRSTDAGPPLGPAGAPEGYPQPPRVLHSTQHGPCPVPITSASLFSASSNVHGPRAPRPCSPHTHRPPCEDTDYAHL